MSILKTDQFIPKAVLTIYESVKQQETDFGPRQVIKTYVEVHPVEKGLVLAGKPLTNDFANSLGKALHQETRTLISGMIPPNLLYAGWSNDRPVLVWHTPIQKVKAFYTPALNIPNGIIEVPALIWRYNDATGALRLGAIKDPISEKTPIYYAPFHNCYDNLGVCLGTAAHNVKNDKLLTYADLMRSVEHIFWHTEFSAIHNTNAIDGNLNSLHKNLVAGRPFPMDKLKLSKTKISALCA